MSPRAALLNKSSSAPLTGPDDVLRNVLAHWAVSVAQKANSATGTGFGEDGAVQGLFPQFFSFCLSDFEIGSGANR
jgi:hypothetical protein